MDSPPIARDADNAYYDLSSFHRRVGQLQGSYRQVSVKFKDFSRTSKRLSYHFQGLKTYEKH